MNPQPFADIRALGRLEACRQDLAHLARFTEKVPQWLPGAAIARQCEKSITLIDHIEARFHHRLVITLVGPSGAGKSTLLNALAGIQDLSHVSHERPTTRQVVVYCKEKADAAQLAEAVGSDDIHIRTQPESHRFDHILLVDTPDTDSMELARHRPILEKVIGLSDVLLCVFDSENPKRMDHADFMSPFLKRFGGESMVVVLNKCDRLDQKELQEVIVPDFRDYLSRAWQVPVDRVLCVSARANLPDPKWPTASGPRHTFDEFPQLTRHIFGTLNQAASVVDRRVENARQIRDYMFGEWRAQLERDRPFLSQAIERMAEAESRALATATDALGSQAEGSSMGIHLMLYQRLAQRWVGPVGWVVALWGRLLVFGAGMVNLLRWGNPVHQVWGMVSTLRRYKKTRSAVDAAAQGDQVSDALMRYQNAIESLWPDIAELLIRGRFDPMVRDGSWARSPVQEMGEQLEGMWHKALNRTLEQSAVRLSGTVIQLIFNLPPMAVMGYVGWITVRDFFLGRVLPSDFFLHAFLTIALVLCICFFLLQAWIRMAASPNRLSRQILGALRSGIEVPERPTVNPLAGQVQLLAKAYGPEPSVPSSAPSEAALEALHTEHRSSPHI